MSDLQRRLILLGPQPNYGSLRGALARLELDGPVALITAGWETEEGNDQEASDAIDGGAINLDLFGRSEQLFADDPELIRQLQKRQDELRYLRDAYNDRLKYLLKASRQLIRSVAPIDLDPERESAIEMVRQLDRQYFVRTSQVCDRYELLLQTPRRTLVEKHRREIASILDRVSAIVIAGGHVAIILNRLKIFGILETQTELPIVAWSGGAMALAEKVVFFHDSLPQGQDDAEVLRAGMGLYSQVLPLPDARNRLVLDDRARVELFARRFNFYKCAILDEHTMLERQDGHWTHHGPAQRLGETGEVMEFSA